MAITTGSAAASTGLSGRLRAAVDSFFSTFTRDYSVGSLGAKGLDCFAQGIVDAINNDKVNLATQVEGTTEAWTVPSLTNLWVAYGAGFLGPAFCKDPTGFVHLRGMVKSGTSNTAIFTLPVGYRPSATIIFRGYGESPLGTPVSANVTITSAGDVTTDVGTGGPAVSLAQVIFDTRA